MRKPTLTKHGDYERTVIFPVWSSYTMHIIFTKDIGESRRARYGDPGETTDARALHSSAKGGHSHLFFRIGDATSGVIAHECWHAIRCMLVDFGGVTVMENEVTAYHLGYLVDQVIQFKGALIDANVGVPENANLLAQAQAKVLGVKSSSRKQVSDGNENENPQGSVVGVQSLPAHSGGTGAAEAREARTPSAPQADGYSLDPGNYGEATSLSRVGN